MNPLTIILLHGAAFILAVSWGGWPVAAVWTAALFIILFIEFKHNNR